MLAYLYTPVPQCYADDVNDLIETILDSSPKQRAYASKFKNSEGQKSKEKTKSTVPNMGVPESQLLEVNSKFPKDAIGKFVYGPVSFKQITQEGDDTKIGFTAKGYRMLNFYTKDPDLIRAFSNVGWGTKFNIPKECPLKIIGKDLMFYVVRLPFDPDRTTHSLGEKLNQNNNELEDSVRAFGDELKSIFNNPSPR
jgi:hypothetical protein